ncbi:hypothetical protein NL533_36105, partial [Klebsiella pneumoniae]|nr:hypothetical protein [Klebsiella pneumoniae]
SEPFTLSQVIYAFERRKFYDITYTSRPADTRILWRKADGGSWTTPLTSVSTCDGPQRYRVIWGSTRSRDYGQMTVRA